MNNNEKTFPNVLIVGTVPYKKSGTSRALDSFFHYWNHNNVAQIFSDKAAPFKGHCGTLFQITDIDLIKRRFNNKEVGTIYNYCDLCEESNTKYTSKKSNWFVSLCYKIGKRRTPLTHLIRKLVWRKKYWCTNKLADWVDSFKPDCIFLSFSDDFFVFEISLYFSKKYNIPIICQIDDDYYFDRHISINPLYYIYKKRYNKVVDSVLIKKRNITKGIFISNKIKNRYKTYFGIDGETIYLASSISRRDFKTIDNQNPIVTYFGNINLGRYKSIIDIANALKVINSNFVINVYTSENNKRILNSLKKHPNIILNDAIPYNEVKQKTVESDVTLVVEDFSKENIRKTRYSLSTKIADVITSGTNIFAFGPDECGAIEYIKNSEAGVVCTNKSDLLVQLRSFLADNELQKKLYNNGKIVAEAHHKVESGPNMFEKVVNQLVLKDEKE